MILITKLKIMDTEQLFKSIKNKEEFLKVILEERFKIIDFYYRTNEFAITPTF